MVLGENQQQRECRISGSTMLNGKLAQKMMMISTLAVYGVSKANTGTHNLQSNWMPTHLVCQSLGLHQPFRFTPDVLLATTLSVYPTCLGEAFSYMDRYLALLVSTVKILKTSFQVI